MKKVIDQLESFHKAFNLPIGKRGELASHDRQALHYDLLIEEIQEYREAYHNKDMVGIADGLADVMFVLVSAIVENGLQDSFEDLFDEVCRSNMSKLDENGKPKYRADGKVLKDTPGYFPPDIKGILVRWYGSGIIGNTDK